jgi:hypothetical protein
MVFLDTNVFLYAAGRDHPLRDPARRVLERFEEGALAANTNVEVVQEILYVLGRRGLLREGLRLARLILALFPEPLSLTPADLADACDLLDRHPDLSPRDAVHIATMRNHGLDTVISADVHFDAVPGIRRIDLVGVS